MPPEPHPDHPEKQEINSHAVYAPYRKWSQDESLKKVWEQSILLIQSALNFSECHVDGTQIIAKKGGESVADQGRKNKTRHIFPVTDAAGSIVGATKLGAGNHHDAYNLKTHLRFGIERTFAWIDTFKRLLIRFDRNDDYFFGGHGLAFAMINLRHKLA